MKRFISLILVFCLLFSSLPLPSLAEDWPEGDETANAPEDEGGDYSGSLETPGLYVGPDEETDEETYEQPEEEPEQEPEQEPEEMPEEEADVPSDPADETPTEEEEPARCDAIDRILDGDFTFADILLALEHTEEWAEDTDAINVSIIAYLKTACDSAAPQETLEQIQAVLAMQDYTEQDAELGEAVAELERFVRAQQLADSLSCSALELLRLDAAAYGEYQSDLAELQALREELTEQHRQQLVFSEPDFAPYLYTFTKGENSWTIHASLGEENTVFLAPGAVPNHADAVSVQLTDGFLLESDDVYFTFGPAGFSICQTEDEAARLYLFRQGGNSEWVNGFTELTAPSEGTYLVCVLRTDSSGNDWLNLLLPAASNNADDHYTALKKIAENEEAADIPDFQATPDTVDITISWDKTVEYVEHNDGHFFAPNSASYTAGTLSSTDYLASTALTDDSQNEIARMRFSVPQAGIWNGSAYMTPSPLENCLFTITAAEGNHKYLVEGGSGLYLDIDGTNSGRHAHPCSGNAKPIYITKNDNGTYQLSSEKTSGYLWHIGSWNVFSNEKYVETDRWAQAAAVKGKEFHLFCKDGSIYYEVNGDTIPNGEYLIAANAGGSAGWLIVRPSNTNASNNDSAAGFLIANRNGTNIAWNYGSMNRCYTTLYFDGLLPGTAELQSLHGSTPFHVEVVNDLDPASLPSLSPGSIDEGKTLYTLIGGEVRARVGGSFEKADISFVNENRTVSAQIVGTTGAQSAASARLWDSKAGKYSGEKLDLQECLYTFSGSDSAWTISAATTDNITVRLCTDHGLVNSTSSNETFTITPSVVAENELTYFTFDGSSGNTLFYWGWKMFTNKTKANEFSSTKKDYGTARFLLYKPAGSGGSCPELPGYQRVHQIVSGEQYLIAAVYENVMCFIRPFSGGGNNDHAAQRDDTLEVATTELSFYGLSVGETTVKLSNSNNTEKKLTIQVLDKVTGGCNAGHLFYADTGAARNARIDRLTISSGMDYSLELRDNGGVPVAADSVIWFSSNREYVSIDQNGHAVFTEPDYLENQEPRFVSIYAYHHTDGTSPCLHQLDVTMLKNDYGDTSEEINVLDYYIAQLDDSVLYLGIPMQYSADVNETNFREVKCYEVIHLRRSNNKPWALNFFVKPNDGYALTYLHANNSASHYYKLDSAVPQKTDFYLGTSQNGFTPLTRQIDMYGKNPDGSPNTDLGIKTVTNLIQKALDYECVAAFGFTRTEEENGNKPQCALYIHSDPLPKVTKSVEYLIPQKNSASLETFKEQVRASSNLTPHEGCGWENYTSGCQLGDTVIFKIHVEIPSQSRNDSTSSNRIFYSEMILKEKTGYRLISLVPDSDNTNNHSDSETLHYTDSETMSILEEMNQSNENGYDFYAYHEITQQDAQDYAAHKEVFNIVTLSATFTTQFQGSKVITEESVARVALKFDIGNAIEYVNLSLDNEITANVYFNIHDSMAKVWAESTSPYFVAVSSGGKKMLYRFEAENENNLWSMSKTAADSQIYNYCRYSIGIGIQDLFQEFTVHIEDQYGMAVTDDFSFTVKRYVSAMLTALNPLLNQEYPSGGYEIPANNKMIQTWCLQNGTKYALKNAQELAALLKNMLNFGYYTQVWMNDSLPDFTPYQENGNSLPEFSAEAFQKQITVTPTTHGITFTGISLVFGNTTLGMRIFFTSEQALNLSKTVGVETHLDIPEGSVKYYELTNATGITQVDSKTYYVQVSNIAPKQLGSKYMISIAMYGEKENGEKGYLDDLATIKIAPMAYVYLLAKESSLGSTQLKDMLAAMYQYHSAAKTYFHFDSYSV